MSNRTASRLVTTTPAPSAALVSSSPPWYASHGELAEVASVLADVFAWDVDGVLHFIEKPWKWTEERARWIALGRPCASTLEHDALDADAPSEPDDREPCTEPGCSLLEHDGRHIGGGKSWAAKTPLPKLGAAQRTMLGHLSRHVDRGEGEYDPGATAPRKTLDSLVSKGLAKKVGDGWLITHVGVAVHDGDEEWESYRALDATGRYGSRKAST